MNNMVSLQRPGDGVIVIAATFTAEPLLPALRFALDQAGLLLDVQFAPYHQVFQELLSSTSLLATNVGGVDVVLERLQDFVREEEDIEEAVNAIRRTGADLVQALVQHSNLSCASIPNNPLSPSLVQRPRQPTVRHRDAKAQNSMMW